jgi:hypothetical protein
MNIRNLVSPNKFVLGRVFGQVLYKSLKFEHFFLGMIILFLL